MTRPIQVVDAFAEAAFAGNPAAVCLLDAPAVPAWMQAVAAEMNLSETAFLVQRPDGFDLHWFTPGAEVDLCGHATLASAHVLWETGRLGPDQAARFRTRSGLLTAERRGEWIELDFPVSLPEQVAAPKGLPEALGVGEPTYVGTCQVGYLVEVEAEEVLSGLAPDFQALRPFPVQGFCVTAAASPGADYDFAARYFAPGVGIDEDPVTGSAYCSLGPYWRQKLGREEFTAYQASARGGLVRVRVEGNRVRIGGRAITVLRGELLA